MRQNKTLKHRILMTGATFGALAPLFVLSVSCGQKRPEIKLLSDKDKTNPNFIYKDGKQIIKGSARDFRNNVLSNPNIVDQSDFAYSLYEFEKDDKGNYKLNKDGKRIIKMVKQGHLAYPSLNVSQNPQKFKSLYSNILQFNDIKRQYEFRAYAFTPEEFKKYFPYSYGKYKKYITDKKKALLLTVYYMEKSNIAYDGHITYKANEEYYENDLRLTVSDRWKQVLQDSYNNISNSLFNNDSKGFINDPANGNYLNHSESLWPFYPMKTISGPNTYIKENVAYPVLLEFEEE